MLNKEETQLAKFCIIQKVISALIYLIILHGFFQSTPAQTRYIRHPIIECYQEPIPVKTKDCISLFYEIHITNIIKEELELKQIDIFNSSDESLQSYVGEDLVNKTRQFGIERNSKDRLKIQGGHRTVVFIQLEFPTQSVVPNELRHEVFYTISDIEKKIEVTSTKFFIRVSPKDPVVIGPPVADGLWFIGNTPAKDNGGHRGSFRTYHGRMGDRARYAVDILGVNEKGDFFSPVIINIERIASKMRNHVLARVKSRISDFKLASDQDEKTKLFELGICKNENWFGYEKEIIAVKNGIIAHVNKGIPDNDQPGNRSVPLNTFENVGGNSIVHDIGEGNFAVYSHLKPGSICVKAGDHVKKGQVIARLGNSGNSDGPHLHFHISDTEYGGEGIPFVFESFEFLGTRWIWQDGKIVMSQQSFKKNVGEIRKMEMPVEGAVIRF